MKKNMRPLKIMELYHEEIKNAEVKKGDKEDWPKHWNWEWCWGKVSFHKRKIICIFNKIFKNKDRIFRFGTVN